MGFGGVFLRFCGLAIRVLQFLDAAVILGIFSYYLAVLAQHHLPIDTWVRAVEGLSGAATLYGLLGVIFVCCLGGVAFFAFVAIVLDVCFTGAMIAIAILTRQGTKACTGTVDTPVGTGKASAASKVQLNFGMACKLEKVTFAVAVIGIFLFLISILFDILLARHHKHEKRFGPSPANDYTSGSRRKWWSRKKTDREAVNANALPEHPAPSEVEMGDKTQAEKGWFGRNTPTPTPPGTTGYGYGNSAYTGNY